MTINEIATQLLTHTPPEAREIPDHADYPQVNAAVMLAMNQALQECFGLGKPWLRKTERGAVLNAPATVAITVTNGSTAATVSGWQDWFSGCSIVIDGASEENRITNNDASAVIQIPYSGESGTHSAIVWQDSITLADDVLAVTGKVRLNGSPLDRISPAEENASVRVSNDYGFQHVRVGGTSVSASAGTPTGYYVHTWSPDSTSAPIQRMRLYPAAGQSHSLTYKVALKPPVVTDLAATTELPIPFEFVQSIYYPIALKHMADSSFWTGAISAQQISDGYVGAVAQLERLRPAKSPRVKLRRRN